MITFIVAYKNLLKEREAQTREFFELISIHIGNNYGLECIVSDFGSTDGIEEELKKYPFIKYIYTEPNEGQFLNMSKCYNHAVASSNNNIIAPLGTDFRFSQNLIIRVIDIFRVLGPIILRVGCFKLNEMNRIQQQTFSPYFLLKNTIMRAGGWDERMYGWGKEEDDLIERVFRHQKLLEHNVRGINYTHVWHDDSFRKIYDTPQSHNSRIMLDNINNKGKNLVNSYWKIKQEHPS